MSQTPGFQAIQYQFAAYIRDPEQNPAPDNIEARRMKIYAELFYNNVEDFMSSTFPVLRELHTDEQWQSLLRDYYSRHQAKTPLFPELAREFLYYLEYERESDTDLPFMLELAHYEWVEAALYLADEEAALSQMDPDGDLLHGLPLISSLAWLLSYNYPVHKISADYIPTELSPAHILVYRDADAEIQFIELNPVTMKLLQLIKNAEHHSSEAILLQLAEELQHPQPEVVIQAGLSLLQDLQNKNVILGTIK
ncbi:MAG: putative DNA-binding domain-containing protein [Gammaproteobacteria bacterium]|nr:putative DNA-binding domain-containing protein [Gammaproteobacteria bacterium]